MSILSMSGVKNGNMSRFAGHIARSSRRTSTVLGHYYNSVSDCNGKIKPKVCKVETFLDEPKNIGGSCPSPSHKFRNHCCCESACCWNGCKKKTPPQNCLVGVPNSQWVVNTKWFNGDKLLYQAVRNFNFKGIYSS